MSAKKYIWLLAVFLMAATGWGTRELPAGEDEVRQSVENRICYDIYLKDPIHPELTAQSYPVMLHLGSSGFPQEYSLSLDTDICLERICKRLGVTLFWDALGRYSRLEYPQDMPFTKKDHSLFLEEDYVQLNEILRDGASILGVYPLGFFVVTPAAEAAGIDAVAGATPPATQAAVVPGAAYTSWVLWRWVNGEVQGQLRAMTLQHCSPDYVNTCLLSGDSNFVQFALRYLLEQRLYDLQYKDTCFQVLEKGGRESCQLALQFLMNLPLDRNELNGRLIKLLGVNADSTRLILEYFDEAPDVPALTWETMAGQLQYVLGYYDIHQILNLLEKRCEESELVNQRVAQLLHRDNRFVVRRARMFLDR